MLFDSIRGQRLFVNPCPHGGGPRGTRTPDLLNAIETRSQLRYGPSSEVRFQPSVRSVQRYRYPITEPSGPEGIRTPDLLSAIEARSQLRYRPAFKAKVILLEAGGDVKQRTGSFQGF